ncbi:MAG: isochorismatase family protein [Mycobacteriales bacterium]
MTLPDLLRPATTALVVVEGQCGVVGDLSVFAELAAAYRETGALAATARLVAAARTVAVPVIHAVAEDLPARYGHSRCGRLFAGARKAGADHAPGSASSRPLPELFVAGDLVLPRHAGLSSLTGSSLDAVLRNEGVRTVVLAGVSLNIAITTWCSTPSTGPTRSCSRPTPSWGCQWSTGSRWCGTPCLCSRPARAWMRSSGPGATVTAGRAPQRQRIR